MEHVTIGCPWCDSEIQVAAESTRHTCAHCSRQIDVAAQFCYLRGLDALAAGRELTPPARKRTLPPKQQAEQTEYYLQAFTAIQEALQGELSPGQRQTSIETMADLARLFADRLMTSPLEASYWAKLATQQNARREYEAVQAKLAQPAGGLLGTFRRWRWQARSRQLAKNEARLRQQVKQLEQTIQFEYRPNVRSE